MWKMDGWQRGINRGWWEWWRAAAVAGGGSEICFERRTGRIGDGYTGNGRWGRKRNQRWFLNGRSDHSQRWGRPLGNHLWRPRKAHVKLRASTGASGSLGNSRSTCLTSAIMWRADVCVHVIPALTDMDICKQALCLRDGLCNSKQIWNRFNNQEIKCRSCVTVVVFSISVQGSWGQMRWSILAAVTQPGISRADTRNQVSLKEFTPPVTLSVDHPECAGRPWAPLSVREHTPGVKEGWGCRGPFL